MSYDAKAFEDDLTEVLDGIKRLLVSKNASYGNSCFEPIGIFAKELPVEQQLFVRIDDKLSRIKNGNSCMGEDTIADLIGYLILWKMTCVQSAKEDQ